MHDCRIQSLWIGEELSLMEILCINSFLAHGHVFDLYTYGPVRGIPDGVTVCSAAEILPADRIFSYQHGVEAGSVSVFANIFRLALLRMKGGIWTDLDMVCLKPFNFDAPYVFSSERTLEGKSKIHNGLIKAPAESPFLTSCLEQASATDPGTVRHGQNGAAVLAKEITRYRLEQHVQPTNCFCPVDYWEVEKLLSSSPEPNLLKNAYAVHLWNEMWRRGIPRNAPAGWLLKLLRQFSELSGQAFRAPAWLIRDKNQIYSTKTVYGALQARYLNQPA